MNLKRDIRADLSERLQAVEAEYSAVHARFIQLEEQRKSIRLLLESENLIWGAAGKTTIPNGVVPLPNVKKLSDILLDLLYEGEWSAKDLAHTAERQGYRFEKSSPARTTHSTLMGIARTGKITSLGNGKWKMSKSEAAQDSTTDEQIEGS